jgi:hypothetical protein
MKYIALAALLSFFSGLTAAESNPDIIRDGEFYYLQS